MYIREGIAYAEGLHPMLKATVVRPLADYNLWLKFNNDEERIFDLKPLLTSPAFSPLKNKEIFDAVYIDHGIITWKNGDIDISPEYLYENSHTADKIMYC